jgi:hypothetical protein
LANSKPAVMYLLLRSGFRLATLPYRPDWWSAAEMVVLLEGSPISTEELELCQSDHRVPPITQFGWAASSRKSLGGSKLLPFKNDRGHCVLGDLHCCKMFLVPFPRSVPRHNHVSELY